MVKAQYEDCYCCSVYELYEATEKGSKEIKVELTCEDIITRCPKLYNCVGYGKPKDSTGCTAIINITYTKRMEVRKFVLYSANSTNCIDPPKSMISDEPCIANGDTIPAWNWSSTVSGQATATFKDLKCSNPNSCLWFCLQQLYPKPYPQDPYTILQCLLSSFENDFEVEGKGQAGSLTCSYNN